MRHALLLTAAVLAASAASAQTPGALDTTREPLEARRNQKVERIQHEDAGSRIEETRYAGQTERITVQPKADVPAYEVQPATEARKSTNDTRQGMGNTGGQRTWNVLKF